MIILGIDPGSRNTGCAIIEAATDKLQCLYHTVIVTHMENLPERLAIIYNELRKIIIEYQPQHAAIENIFVQHNVMSALKLGHARGAALTAIASVGDLEIYEYSARQIKQALVGSGAADKLQVQAMAKSLVKLSEPLKLDASDALACAICHYHTHVSLNKWQLALQNQRGKK